MVEYIYETGDNRRSRIAERVGVSPDEITNATKRLRRITAEIVDQHADMDGAVTFHARGAERRTT